MSAAVILDVFYGFTFIVHVSIKLIRVIKILYYIKSLYLLEILMLS